MMANSKFGQTDGDPGQSFLRARPYTSSRSFVIFLAAVASLTSLSIDLSLPGVPLIEQHFGVPQGRGSLTISFFVAGYSFTPLIAGPLSDRVGRYRILAASLLLYAGTALACCLAPGFLSLLILRFLQGCFAGASTTLPLAIVKDTLKGNLARERMSEVISLRNLVPIFAPALGSFLLFGNRWRLLFVAQGCFVLLLALLIFCLPASFGTAPKRDCRSRDWIPFREYGQVFRNRRFRLHALVYGIYFASVFSFLSLSPLILMQRMKIPSMTYALLFGLNSTGTILGAGVGARLNRANVPVKRIVLGGLLLSLAASTLALAVCCAHAATPATLLPEVFLALFGFGMSEATITLGALEELPHISGSGSGVLRCILMLSGFITSGLLSFVTSRLLHATEVITTATMTLAALAATALYFRTSGKFATKAVDSLAE